MTHLFYHLAREASEVHKLRQEISSKIGASGQIDNTNLQHLDHLNAVIDETLRLHPPVPTAIPRLTPPEGIQIGETYVPGNVTVWCPPYVMGRSELTILLPLEPNPHLGV